MLHLPPGRCPWTPLGDFNPPDPHLSHYTPFLTVIYARAAWPLFTVQLRMHTHGLAVDICLYVRLSVCQTREL